MSVQDLSGAFEQIERIAYAANSYLGRHEFWNLIKSDEHTGGYSKEKLDLLEEVLFVNFDQIRILSLLLMPYCPVTADAMLNMVVDRG